MCDLELFAGQTVGFKAVITDDEDGRPLCPIPSTVSVEIRTADEGEQLLVPTTMTLQVRNKGTASAGSTKTLTDASKAWLADQWAGVALRITAGTGADQERRIKSNTATVLTIDEDHVVNGEPQGVFATQPDATSVYQIHDTTYRLNWDSPEEPSDDDLVAIVRAKKNDPEGWLSPKKLHFRLQAPSVPDV